MWRTLTPLPTYFNAFFFYHSIKLLLLILSQHIALTLHLRFHLPYATRHVYKCHVFMYVYRFVLYSAVTLKWNIKEGPECEPWLVKGALPSWVSTFFLDTCLFWECVFISVWHCCCFPVASFYPESTGGSSIILGL